ncbi:unnamed protein product [Protopolystoma xenopodis]|uniref:Uncharacterized protein n=1 Tax=Protopolystoma xenopodis TaxID=117903 RepID=A0A3S5AHA2_9PLAT|nr:unnamed protein product [Protopolystoma xenopodis]
MAGYENEASDHPLDQSLPQPEEMTKSHLINMKLPILQLETFGKTLLINVSTQTDRNSDSVNCQEHEAENVAVKTIGNLCNGLVWCASSNN